MIMCLVEYWSSRLKVKGQKRVAEKDMEEEGGGLHKD